MMLCAALTDQRVKPEYSSLLSNPIPPGVNNLKVWIEEAWKSGEYLHQSAPACLDPLTSGFDPEGAQELKCELVGHKKWIGTAGKIITEYVYQLADLRTYKNCTWHSRTEESRKLTPSIETRLRVSLQLAQGPTCRF
jgi:hypothetical protein